jgi:hypothetical protein
MFTKDVIERERQWYRDNFALGAQMKPEMIDSDLVRLKVYNLMKGQLPTIDGSKLNDDGHEDLDIALPPQEKTLSAGSPVHQITEYTDLELANLEKELIACEHEAGTPHALAQVRFELLRRSVGSLDGLKILRYIIQTCFFSKDRKADHVDLYWEFFPTDQYDERGGRTNVILALKAVMLSCMEYNLPQLATLIVTVGRRQLSKHDIRLIYTTDQYLCRDVGVDIEAYIREQTRLSEKLVSQLFDKMVREFQGDMRWSAF